MLFLYKKNYSPLLEKQISETCPKLTKLNKRERPQSAVDPLGVIRDDELFLKLVQEAEGQDIGIVFCANHHVPNSERACKTMEGKISHSLHHTCTRVDLISIKLRTNYADIQYIDSVETCENMTSVTDRVGKVIQWT